MFAPGDFRTGLVLRLFWLLPEYVFKRCGMAMRGMMSRFGASNQVTRHVPNADSACLAGVVAGDNGVPMGKGRPNKDVHNAQWQNCL